MVRRNFLQRFTMTGTSSLAALGITQASGLRSVTYKVAGFSCVTCAVGLDTMLGRQRGIVRSKSTYPEGLVVIEFDPRAITEAALVAFITERGFRVFPPQRT